MTTLWYTVLVIVVVVHLIIMFGRMNSPWFLVVGRPLQRALVTRLQIPQPLIIIVTFLAMVRETLVVSIVGDQGLGGGNVGESFRLRAAEQCGAGQVRCPIPWCDVRHLFHGLHRYLSAFFGG